MAYKLAYKAGHRLVLQGFQPIAVSKANNRLTVAGTTSTPENDDLSQSHATTTTSEHGDLSTSHGEPDLRATNSKNDTSDTSSSFSTTSTSSSTTSTSTTTTSTNPPPPTSAPYKPGDFLLCSITSGMADHLPKDGL
ncbi:uncharacterized protein LOC135376210 [Ornithodoros turicata]|uniref:uncharacterized protein LOC135376210 n=1 Tax=Ornithodoros turicata TaxID=34597 RepID=UPI003138E612